MGDFFSNMLPYAQKASKALDIPVSVILSQWAVESAYGTSQLAKNHNNYGGVTWVGSSIAKGKSDNGVFASYNNADQFTQDYIRVMKLGYYDQVRKADTVEGTVKALAESPYAESHYGGGTSIVGIIKANNLTKYDGQTQTGNLDMIGKANSIIDNLGSDDLKKYAMVGVVGAILLGMSLQD